MLLHRAAGQSLGSTYWLLLSWLPCLLCPQLRDQRAHIEELVDAVVEGYHGGFNKSIHNYSQILRLFTESKLQVVGRVAGLTGPRLEQLPVGGLVGPSKAGLVLAELPHDKECSSWRRRKYGPQS